jgi:aryl-alcohol dehydrogenase-like predicted oxidoreductase
VIVARASKVGLGTAQLGMDYGISNPDGRVRPDEAAPILARAGSAGVRVLDTAASYGDAEERLGELLGTAQAFSIVTKLPPVDAAAAPADAGAWVREAVDRSLGRLRQDRLYAVLAHGADTLLGPGGAEAWEALETLRAAGTVARIGASVYTGDEIDALLDRYPVGLVQVPVNVLDQRLVRSGHLARLRAAGVEVHARSVFLQGVLLMEPDTLPSPQFDGARETLQAFRSAVRAAGTTALEAAAAYVLGLEGVDTAVFGVTSERELEEILVAANTTTAANLPEAWFAPFAVDDERVLNPARWPR